MVQIKVYNQDGNVAGEITAPEFLLQKWNAALAHQVFKAMAANQRQPVAHTKTRGEVSGGGKKPWRQKGTGRARHGSIRSPLWRHGGVTFGPRNTTDYSQKVNKKMLRQALREALAKKFSLGELKVINEFPETDGKTKNAARMIKNLTGQKSTLLLLSEKDQNLKRAVSNLAGVETMPARDLNVYEALNHKYVLMDQKTLEKLAL